MKQTQCEMIIKYINEFGSITSQEAFVDLGCTRLASRICDLKKRGYEFEKTYETSKNRFGENVKYIRYRLRGEEE